MKSYTDLSQSKVLSEILPLESADMFWLVTDQPRIHAITESLSKYDRWENYPAWSLSALLNHLKQKYYVRLDHDGVSWGITCVEHDTNATYSSFMFDDPIDACWGMILRLDKEE